MVRKKSVTNWGSIAYLIGIALVVLVAIYGWISPAVMDRYWPYLTLGLLGTFVGLVNITEKEKNRFLIASIVFMAASLTLDNIFAFWAVLPYFFNLMIAFVAPAASIIALIEIFSIAKGK